MRTFEIALWIMGAGWAGWELARPLSRRVRMCLGALSLVAALLHGGVEGARFHMIPTYVLTASLVAAGLNAPAARKRWPRWVRAALGIPLAVFVVIGAALPTIFPVFRYDALSGPYAVGTAEYELKRPHQAATNRDLVLQAWYPIAPGSKGSRAAITSRPDLLEGAFASFTGLPRLVFDNLRLVETHAIAGAPLTGAIQRLPIVLFSHGPLGANRSQSIFQMEALASRGFLVVAIDHTGYASTTIFPDGHAVPPSPDAVWPVFVDERSTAMLHTWVADVRFVIDQLEALNASDPNGLLTGRLDLSRIGYLGASFGGSVVVQALLDEPRIKAGVAEDGKPYFSDATLTDLRRPLMYLQSAMPYITSTDAQLAKWGLTAARFKVAEQDHYGRLMQLFARSNGPIYDVYIRGTNHLTFSDLYLIIGLPDSQLGDIRHAHRVINDYTAAFFDRYLNGRPSPLVDGRSPASLADVTVMSRNIEPLEQSVEGGSRSVLLSSEF
jgi:predicted dienelactone hydrolase